MIRLSREFKLPLHEIQEWSHEEIELQLSYDYICSGQYQKDKKIESSIITKDNIEQLKEDLKWLT